VARSFVPGTGIGFSSRQLRYAGTWINDIDRRLLGENPPTERFAQRHTYSSMSRRFLLVSVKLLEADGLGYKRRAVAYFRIPAFNCEINSL
jgi:hypothetical protein